MKEGEQMAIPHLFRCPISLDLFQDPVTLSTGQTYDRSSIEKWLAAGNLTCPVTMQKLDDPSFVPNHTLRHLINQWLQMDSGTGGSHHNFDLDNYLTKFDSLAVLKLNLESPETSMETKLQTLENILLLLSQEPSSVSCLLQLRFLPLLLHQVFGKAAEFDKFSQEYVNFIQDGLSCVSRLLLPEQMECLNMLLEESKLKNFISLFEQGNCIIKKSLCHLIDLISSSAETKDLCSQLGKNSRILDVIVLIILQDSEASDPGIMALSGFCSLESNRESIVRSGAINGLITYILNAERREKSLAAVAMSRIEELLVLEIAKEAVVKLPNGVQALVKMVFRVSDHEGSESAVNSLMILCCDSLEVREEAIGGGVLSQLLLLLQSQCGNRTKSMANTLLKMLRSKWGEES
ncbi:U-box domain-containing protein 26-like [Mangifera indica]|uniref:U-box domain-containing protein 26-like n=1 Tax=Mangifera indica TaxID=29780 RepID=UPI001CF9C8AA|nr:U-box domain-containing protein 26-like [Mangifera indica]